MQEKELAKLEGQELLMEEQKLAIDSIQMDGKVFHALDAGH